MKNQRKRARQKKVLPGYKPSIGLVIFWGIILAALVLRTFLKAAGVTPYTSFAAYTYLGTELLVLPFVESAAALFDMANYEATKFFANFLAIGFYFIVWLVIAGYMRRFRTPYGLLKFRLTRLYAVVLASTYLNTARLREKFINAPKVDPEVYRGRILRPKA